MISHDRSRKPICADVDDDHDGLTEKSAARWLVWTALAMIFKLAQAAEKSWRRLRGRNQLPKVILGVKFNDGIEVVKSQVQAAAA
jgi:hypothetical protein